MKNTKVTLIERVNIYMRNIN